MKPEKHLENFIQMLRSEKYYSPHTCKNYARDLSKLAEFLLARDIGSWSQVSFNEVSAYAAYRFRNGLKSRSIQRELSSIRSFYQFLIHQGAMKSNPAKEVSAPKSDHRLPKTCDAEQLGQLLHPQDNDDELIVRDLAMFELIYSSGLRLAELVDLDPPDVDLDDGLVRVTGKGRKDRIIPVGRKARDAIVEWLRARAELAGIEESALFVGTRGRRISPRSIQQRVRYWAQQAGIPQRVYPHLFRHSFATHVLESSRDLRGVQELLGHADISTTQVYTHLDFQHLAQIYDKAHPRARRRSK